MKQFTRYSDERDSNGKWKGREMGNNGLRENTQEVSIKNKVNEAR